MSKAEQKYSEASALFHQANRAAFAFAEAGNVDAQLSAMARRDTEWAYMLRLEAQYPELAS